MSDDKNERLVRALRDLAREEDADALADPRWEKLSEGAATDEDRAALRALAERSPIAREAPEVFAPIGDAARARFADRIAAEIAASRAAKAPDATRERSEATRAKPGEAAPEAPSNVLQLAPRAPRGRLFQQAAVIGTVLAMAAAVVLAIFSRSGAGALPAYTLALSAGEADVRGDPAQEAPLLRPGARITATLRPATRVAGAIRAAAFLVQAGSAEPIAARVEASEDGAVRVIGTLGKTLAARPGSAEIVIVVARPEALPGWADPDLSADAEGRRQVVRHPVRIAEVR